MPRTGRHLYAHKRRSSRLLVSAIVVAVAGGGVAAATLLPSWLRSRSADTSATPTVPVPSCPSARLAAGARLGAVAWVDAGILRLLDLDSCEQRILVADGAAAPVRFSRDGRWVAYGDGAIVAADGGGQIQNPIGHVVVWRWSPTADELAGVTTAGGIVVGGPDEEQRILLDDGSKVGHVAFSPDGASLGVDVGGAVVAVVDATDGAMRTIYRVSSGTNAPPQVTGWSPDGRWVLFFSRFAGTAGVPLNTAPAEGGDWVNVFDPVLPYDDFVTWCGHRMALSGGGDQTPSEGNQILLSGPPDWRYDNLSGDFSRSWIWPACSPNGKWLVATATPSHTESPPGRGIRALWLLATDGSRRTRLTGAGNDAYEAARWSADGRFVLVVRRGLEVRSPGALLLFRVDPSTGKAARAPGPIARIGAAPGDDGHTDWSITTDWYRPS